MKTITSTECKTRLGEYLETVRIEPVTIKKAGSPVAVLLSVAEYERLQSLENAYWLARAKQAESTGYIGSGKSKEPSKKGSNS